MQLHSETVHLDGIRCFAEPQAARLGQITVLVGENSTGKSTFLAVTSMLSKLLEPYEINFNREPFILGSYRDIATIKTNGRANIGEFSIGVEGQVIPHKLPFYIDQDEVDITRLSKQPKPYKVLTSFVSKSGQPVASHSDICIDEYRLNMDWLADRRSRIKSISIGSDTVKAKDLSRNSRYYFIDLPEFPSFLVDSERDLNLIFGKDRPGSFNLHEVINLFLFRAAVQDALNRRAAYAIAPIRSMPKRTYDPVQSLPRPEGGHVPMILARAFREDQDEWIRIKEKLGKFGQLSGLFRELSVRPLGESASDPFQLTVRVKDEPVNLLDVGYGVSQILPIIVDTLIQPSTSLFLLQQPEVHLHPRGQAALATFLLEQTQDSNQRFIVETHSDQIIDRLRIEIRDRKLDPQIFSLLYFERGERGVTIHEIELDSHGNMMNAPSSYRDFFLAEEYSLLGI